MNIRRLQGLFLILSGVCALVGLLGSNGPFFNAINLAGVILFILGILAIPVTQPMGWLGWAGIALVELAALIAMGFQAGLLNGTVLILTSAISGTVGRLIVGWLTTRGKVFPAWVGWAFILEGLLNFLGGVVQLGSLANGISILTTLIGAAALFGYGFIIFRKKA
jgi:hypothetical protein